jgi:SAM-dependent methyltransferase
MNERQHWNHIAPTYNDEIFDVFNSDKNKVLLKYFTRYGNRKHRVIDFGCGVGKAFPYLAPRFKEVVAVDISDACLAQAQHNAFTNVKYLQKDLSKPGIRLPLSEFVFCVNVIMLPEPERNKVMFKNVCKALRPGGAAVLVLPAMESYLFAAWRLMDWYGREKVSPEKIPEHELSGFQGSTLEIIQGILQINDVKTKHYLQDELNVLLREAGFKKITIEKVEYDWTSEFSDPPAWMKAPFPFDWLVEAKR